MVLSFQGIVAMNFGILNLKVYSRQIISDLKVYSRQIISDLKVYSRQVFQGRKMGFCRRLRKVQGEIVGLEVVAALRWLETWLELGGVGDLG